ncbi:MAG: hypothetical protein PHX80_03795 [Candidatus Nanoarchaeia archaeon]|nr:hypothetical protein [Candidatus Nanoarchaeia archaeon]
MKVLSNFHENPNLTRKDYDDLQEIIDREEQRRKEGRCPQCGHELETDTEI